MHNWGCGSGQGRGYGQKRIERLGRRAPAASVYFRSGSSSGVSRPWQPFSSSPLISLGSSCGAYGGFAVVTEASQALLRGIECADSVGLDAHKWFFQPYEVGGLLVKDLRTLEHAFAVHHDVLQDTIWGANHPNLSDRSLQLSRSFKALKIWMSVQVFGMDAFRHAIAQGMELAERAGAYIEAYPILELLNPVSLGIVCFRVNPGHPGLDEAALEKINRAVLAHVFWDDRAFMSSTTLAGKLSLRLCIINHTAWEDVQETLEAIVRFGDEAATGEGAR